MKKSFLLLCASQLVFAQELLFNQQPQSTLNTFNAISTNVFTGTKGIFVADDFEFTKKAKIKKVKAFARVDAGFLSANNVVQWNVVVYQNSNAKPSGIPGKVINGTTYVFSKFPVQGGMTVTPSATDPQNITVEFDVSDCSYVFNANTKYWVAIYPTVQENTTNFFNQKNFYWAASTSNLPKLEEAKIVDPDNLMGQGYTNWTNVSNATMAVSGMAFEIYGEEYLSTNETSKKSLSIYPNPATKFVNINHNVKNVYIYSSEGKQVISTSEAKINVESLPKGTYFIKMILEDGVQITDKFIKN
ncbi:T9SS type A sorting domain-containing protein [Chryseobacterium sp. KACC 21268]|nr:T9SS type A sorting domain-containing protein [Chryseobacterium sp. KACC 21268]